MQFESKDVEAAIAWSMGERTADNYTELGTQAADRFLAWARPQIDKMTDIERGPGTMFAFMCSSYGEVLAFVSLLGLMTKWTAHQAGIGTQSNA